MAAKRLTAGSVDEFRRTEHGFSAIFRAILALVGRARLAEVSRDSHSIRFAYGLLVARGASAAPIAPHSTPFSISNLSFRSYFRESTAPESSFRWSNTGFFEIACTYIEVSEAIFYEAGLAGICQFLKARRATAACTGWFLEGETIMWVERWGSRCFLFFPDTNCIVGDNVYSG